MKNWIEKEQPSKDDIQSLNETLKIPAFICSLLLQRNINSLEKAKQFFRPNIDLLHDPFLMKDMLKVVEMRLTSKQMNKSGLVCVVLARGLWRMALV